MKRLILQTVFFCAAFFCVNASVAKADPSGGGAWTVVDERFQSTGNSPASALPLNPFGILPIRVLGQIAPQTSDYYRIDVATPSHVEISGTSILDESYLSMTLEGNGVSRDGYISFGRESKLSARFLRPGTYYLRVQYEEGRQPIFYNLFLTGTVGVTIPDDPEGNTPETALRIPQLAGEGSEFVHRGWVDPEVDEIDVFQFVLGGTEPREVLFRLDEMTGDGDMALLNSAQQTIGSSYNEETKPEMIRIVLRPRTRYTLQIRPSYGAVHYRLTIQIGPVGVPEPDPGFGRGH